MPRRWRRQSLRPLAPAWGYRQSDQCGIYIEGSAQGRNGDSSVNAIPEATTDSSIQAVEEQSMPRINNIIVGTSVPDKTESPS
jgi:hypothetical protein